MPNKIDEQDKDQIYRMMLDGHKPKAIEEALGNKIKRRAVAWHIDKIKRTMEYQIIKEGAHDAVQTYGLVRDAIQKQIVDLTEQLSRAEEDMNMEIDSDDPKIARVQVFQRMAARSDFFRIQDMIQERWLNLFKIQADGTSVLALRKKMLGEQDQSEGIPNRSA